MTHPEKGWDSALCDVGGKVEGMARVCSFWGKRRAVATKTWRDTSRFLWSTSQGVFSGLGMELTVQLQRDKQNNGINLTTAVTIAPQVKYGCYERAR